MSMSRQMLNFWRRPWLDQWLFFQAYTGLGMARLAIQAVPFAKLAPFLGKHMTESIEEIPGEKMEQARRVAWAVRCASPFTPWTSDCLPQAITAKYLLRWRGIDSTLYLGAALDDAKSLKAHAWLRCGSGYVTGGPGHKEFGVLASFAEKIESPNSGESS